MITKLYFYNIFRLKIFMQYNILYIHLKKLKTHLKSLTMDLKVN